MAIVITFPINYYLYFVLLKRFYCIPKHAAYFVFAFFIVYEHLCILSIFLINRTLDYFRAVY